MPAAEIKDDVATVGFGGCAAIVPRRSATASHARRRVGREPVLVAVPSSSTTWSMRGFSCLRLPVRLGDPRG